MKKLAFFVFLLCISSGITIASHATSPVQSTTPITRLALPKKYTTEDKIYALSTLWSELKFDFVYLDRAGFDLDSLYRATIPQALATQNDIQFFDLLKRFMARFGDGHTGIGGYSYKWNDVFDYAPLLIEPIGGRYYISQLWESSGLDSLALGAEIVRIEDVPTREYVEQTYFPAIAQGSESAKLLVAANEIGTGFPGSRFRAEVKCRDGKVIPVDIVNNYTALEKQRQNGRSWQWHGIRKPRRASVSLEWLDRDVAWVDFRSFNHKDSLLLDSLLHDVKARAKGAIIDLRYCPGGSSTIGERLMPYLVDADYYLTDSWQTRIGNAYGRAQGNYRPEYEPFYRNCAYETYPSDTVRLDRTKTLKCPVVILIGNTTASAAETFLVNLYEIPGRPAILGQQTQGTTGAPYVIKLPHGAWARICTVRRLFPYSKKVLDGIGILPDTMIEPTIDDYFSGRDRVLEETIKNLIRK